MSDKIPYTGIYLTDKERHDFRNAMVEPIKIEKEIADLKAELEVKDKKVSEILDDNIRLEKKIVDLKERLAEYRKAGLDEYNDKLTAEKARGERSLASFKKFLYRGENANDSLEFAYRAEAEKAIKEYEEGK